MGVLAGRLLPERGLAYGIVHRVLKGILYKTIYWGGDLIKPIYDKKVRNGFVNPEVGVFNKEWDEVIEAQEKTVWADPNNDGHHRKLWQNMKMMSTVLLDEDTAYLIRFYHLIGLIIRDRDKYKHTKKAVTWHWDWQIAKKMFLEGASPKEIDAYLDKLKSGEGLKKLKMEAKKCHANTKEKGSGKV